MTTKKSAVLNDTSAVLLGLLHEGPTHGGDLVDTAERWMPYFSITRSQAYRELHAMAEKQLIRPVKQIPKGGLVYAITPAGKRMFAEWYNQPLGLDLLRNTVAARIAFLGVTNKANFSTVIFNAKKMHAEEAERIQGLIKEAKADGLADDVRALQFSYMYHRQNVTWLEGVEEDFAKV